MSTLSIWIAIFGLAGVTVATRAFFVVLGDRMPLPARVQHALRYAPVCALVALIAPELIMNGPVAEFGIGNGKLMAGLAAVATMLVTRNAVVSIVVGMGAFTFLRLA